MIRFTPNSTPPLTPQSPLFNSPAQPVLTVRPRSVGRTLKEHRRYLFGQAMLFLLLVCCSLASYYIVSHYILSAVVIRGRSMLPTLQDGDQYLLNRLTYHYKSPQRGDLVVIRDPGHSDLAVKRIVAGPSDQVQFKHGDVYLNGVKLDEPYLKPGTQTFPSNAYKEVIMVGEGRYFVLGDNRAESEDGRYYGPILRDNILGMISK